MTATAQQDKVRQVEMKTAKQPTLLLLTILCVSFLTGCSKGPDSSQEKYVIKIAYSNQPGEPTDLGVQEWRVWLRR